MRACMTTIGYSILPMPWPEKSRRMVTCDCSPSPRGSTVTLTFARIGLSMPRIAHVPGGLISVISDVVVRCDADAPGHLAPVPDRKGAVSVGAAADDPGLPFAEPRRVGDIGKDLLRRASDLDIGHDWCHRCS
jgi:hypothetical protein